MIAHDIRKTIPVVSWDCISAARIVALDERHRPGWCMLLAVWRRLFVMAQYVIGGGRQFGVIFYTQEGAFLRVILYPIVSFIIGRQEDAHGLKPLGGGIIIYPVKVLLRSTCVMSVHFCSSDVDMAASKII